MATTEIFGQTQIQPGSVFDAEVASNAAIAGTKISANFGTQNLTVDTTTLFVSSTTHQVGVGTISPATRLNISGPLGAQCSLRFDDTSVGGGSWQLGETATTSKFDIKDVSGGIRLTIDGSGFVSIGTTTANNRLTVSGSADISGSLGIGNTSPGKKLDVSGDIRVNGNFGLYQGRFTTAQETTFTGGLVAGDGGVVWFNTTDSQFKGWNGSTIVILG